MSIRISIPRLATYSTGDNPLAGRYVIEREIGSGGMAVVFLARDLRHERHVAVKVLRDDMTSRVDADRFLREIHIAAGLAHPNILPVHDSGSAEGMLFYVMPYIEGETLAARLAREGRLPLEDVLKIAAQVGRALQFAHDRGIVHRDVKPENVLMPGGVAVVADFGLARAVEREDDKTQLTQVGMGLGTPAYISPEQALGEGDVDARSDQYSFACVVYEMLTGRPPFEGTLKQILAQQISKPAPRALALRPGLPPAVDVLLQRALSKAPEARFPSIEDLVGGLEAAVTGKYIAGTPRALPGISRRAVLAVIGVVVAAAAFVAVRRVALSPRSAVLDDNVVVIAPFDAIGEPLQLWREGMMDVLSRALDGAGPLRTVSPTLVARAWNDSGRADRVSASELARATGAGLAVVGQLLSAGDSVRAMITIVDVRGDSSLSEGFEVRGLASRMDQVADSLAIRVLQELGRARKISTTRTASLQTRTLPALKAFLRGEQLYRKNDFAGARAQYEQAIAEDSGFALAYLRAAGAIAWMGPTNAATRREYRVRAGALNRGLGPRDSLLVLAESLAVATPPWDSFVEPSSLNPARRRFQTLGTAMELYARDPEVWHALAAASLERRNGRHPEQALIALEGAIAADSLFGPSYVNAIPLALAYRGRVSARVLAQKYLRISPLDAEMALLIEVLDGDRSDKTLRRALAKSEPTFRKLAFILAKWPDAEETGVRMYRLLLERPDPPVTFAAAALRFRGHLQEAMNVPDREYRYNPTLVDETAALYARFSLSEARALDSLSRIWVRDGIVALLPLAARAAGDRRDTTFLRTIVAAAMERERRVATPVERIAWRFAMTSAMAYAALARGDSTAAVSSFQQLADTLAPHQAVAPIVIDAARLMSARGHAARAAGLLDRHPPSRGLTGYAVLWDLERARAEAVLGRGDRARRLFESAENAWRTADPSLRLLVADVRAAVERGGTAR